jgi:hypothetical protein
MFQYIIIDALNILRLDPEKRLRKMMVVTFLFFQSHDYQRNIGIVRNIVVKLFHALEL